MTSPHPVVRASAPSAPLVRAALKSARDSLVALHHSLAERVPALIAPRPRQLTIAVTAQCNLRCIGCRYGRDFMPGESLALATVRAALDDARAAGVRRVRLYGGEPLLHPDLPAMVAHATELGLRTYVTTNGTLLERRIDELVAAGLRTVTVGTYGTGETFDAYTQRPAQRGALERGLRAARERGGPGFEIQLNFVVVRPLATVEALDELWALARRFDAFLHVDLYGYSIPFFTSGPERELAFRPDDAPLLARLVERLIEIRREAPERVPHAEAFLRSIPDWVLRCADMRVPCDAYELVWIGADGSVQLCDTAFPLGNLNQSRLAEILFTDAHRRAARDGFLLRCPNCTCKVDSRIRRHAASRRRYSREGGA